jgi:hypothetical protein
MAKALRRAQYDAPLRTIPHELPAGNYVPQWQPLRPGADDALKIPSRSGNRLTYRDGRVETLA